VTARAPAPVWVVLCAVALSALGWSRMFDQQAERARSRALDVVVMWRPRGAGTPTFGALMRRAARSGAPMRLEPGHVDVLSDVVHVSVHVKAGRAPPGGLELRVDTATRSVEAASSEGGDWFVRLAEIQAPP